MMRDFAWIRPKRRPPGVTIRFKPHNGLLTAVARHRCREGMPDFGYDATVFADYEVIVFSASDFDAYEEVITTIAKKPRTRVQRFVFWLTGWDYRPALKTSDRVPHYYFDDVEATAHLEFAAVEECLRNLTLQWMRQTP